MRSLTKLDWLVAVTSVCLLLLGMVMAGCGLVMMHCFAVRGLASPPQECRAGGTGAGAGGNGAARWAGAFGWGTGGDRRATHISIPLRILLPNI